MNAAEYYHGTTFEPFYGLHTIDSPPLNFHLTLESPVS